MPSVAQETCNYNGKIYFVYPNQEVKTRGNSLDYNSTSYMKDRMLGIKTEILPNFNNLKDGAYVILYKNKRDKIHPACFFSLENNLPEGKATWVRHCKDTIEIQNYSNGLKHGEETVYSDKGNLFIKAKYKTGLLHGEYKSYFWNSDQLQLTGKFENNLKQPGSKFYDKYGNLSSEEILKDSIVTTTRYLINELKSKDYHDINGTWISTAYYYEDGNISDSTYPARRAFYYPQYSEKTDLFWEQLEQMPKLFRVHYMDNVHSLFYPNGQPITTLWYGNATNSYEKKAQIEDYSDGFYFDTIFNEDGSVKDILDERNFNDSAEFLLHHSYYYEKRKLHIVDYEFNNGILHSLKEVILNRKGDTTHLYSSINEKLLRIEANDTILVLENKIGKNYYREFKFLEDDSIITRFEAQTKYSNGRIKENIKGSFDYRYERLIKLPIPSQYDIYTKDGLQITKDSIGRIAIGKEFLNGFYKFKINEEIHSFQETEWLTSKEKISLKNLKPAGAWGYPSSLVPQSWGEPLSGYFVNGIQDSIWKIKDKKHHLKYNVLYKEGLLNGTIVDRSEYSAYFNKLQYSSLYNHYFTIEPITNTIEIDNALKTLTHNLIYENDILIEVYTYLKNDNLISYINLKDSTQVSYTISPSQDTLSKQIKRQDTYYLYSYNANGISSKRTIKNDTIHYESFNGDLVTFDMQTKNNIPYGISTVTDEISQTQIIREHNKSIPTPTYYQISSGEMAISFSSNEVPHSTFFSNGKIIFEGYSNNDNYIYSRIFYLKNSLFFPDETLQIEFFVDTVSDPKNWLKEYYSNGQIKAEANQFNIESEHDCDNNTKLKFDYLPSNYWNREGKQTLTNGTGYVFFKDEGTPVYEGEMKDSLQVGIWKHYDGNGNLTEFGKYVDGEKDGVWYSGDLTHIHFLEECLDTDHPKYEERKAYLENQVNITTEIYKNGELIQAVRQSN